MKVVDVEMVYFWESVRTDAEFGTLHWITLAGNTMFAAATVEIHHV